MFKLTTASAAVVLLTGTAHAVTFDFEDFDHGEAVTSISAEGITAQVDVVSNGSFQGAVAFDTSLTGTADPDLEAPFTGSGSANPGKILIISEDGGPDDERLGGTITLSFDQVVDVQSFEAFDDGLFELTSAKGDELLFAEDTVSGDNVADFVPVGFTGVQSLTFTFMSSGQGASGGIDNIMVTPSSPAVIPVPAALPLLAAGLGGLVLVGRRRRA